MEGGREVGGGREREGKVVRDGRKPNKGRQACSGQKEQKLKRPWGGRMLGMLEEEQEEQNAWAEWARLLDVTLQSKPDENAVGAP